MVSNTCQPRGFHEVVDEDVRSPRAREILDRLSATLEAITGDPGTSSFDANDVEVPRSAFVLAVDPNSHAVEGCGAIRPIDDATAELKRMFAGTPGRGIGSLLLAHLEARAWRFGYRRIVLETRRVNTAAVQFYRSHGYLEVPNYGKYVGRVECLCFEKGVPTNQ